MDAALIGKVKKFAKSTSLNLGQSSKLHATQTTSSGQIWAQKLR